MRLSLTSYNGVFDHNGDFKEQYTLYRAIGPVFIRGKQRSERGTEMVTVSHVF